MAIRKIFTSIIIAFTFLSSCIKQVNLDTRKEKPILVVEGGITNDSVPYTVKLTYSGPYQYALDVPEEYLEKSANVTIKDDLGHQTALAYKGDGIYETTDPAYVGIVGRSYSIAVELKDGKKYVSTPEKIHAPVPIEQYKAKFISDFNGARPAYLQVSVDTKDPADEENYYRWSFYSWILRQTKGVGCGFGCIMFEYCYQKNVDVDVHVLSDASVNGNEIKDKIIGKSYIYTYGDHYIDIAQHSLTREAYQFWQNYDAQVSRSGSTLDPLPAPVKGNVHSASDLADIALGYFSASAVTHTRAILVPYSITQYLLDQSAKSFIPDGFVACFEYLPNTLAYPSPPAPQYPPPPGWQNAEILKVYW